MRYIIWGAGGNLRKTLDYMNEFQMDVRYIIDSESKKWGMFYDNYEIKNPLELKKEKEVCTIVISSMRYEDIIIEDLKRLDSRHKVIRFSQFVRKQSYSEFGEDIICAKILERIRIAEPYYMDIGIPEGIFTSNTRYFYDEGCHGICVEANPDSIEDLKKVRFRDKILNLGVSGKNESGMDLTYYCIDKDICLNTFDPDIRDLRLAQGFHLKEEKKIRCICLDEICEEYCEKTPDFISLDVEGLETQILRDFNFERYGVSLWCIEKREGINDIMEENGYKLVAETPSNYIFCLKDKFEIYIEKWFEFSEK